MTSTQKEVEAIYIQGYSNEKQVLQKIIENNDFNDCIEEYKAKLLEIKENILRKILSIN